MTIVQFVMMAIASLLMTIPAVVLIPRARQSLAFDRVLWVATWGLGFLGAWGAPNYINSESLNGIAIAGVSLVPLLIWAAVGAWSINGLLWIMDHLNPPSAEEMLDTTGVDKVDEKLEQPNEQ